MSSLSKIVDDRAAASTSKSMEQLQDILSREPSAETWQQQNNIKLILRF